MTESDTQLREQLSRACSLAEICFASVRLRPLSPNLALATLEAMEDAAIEAIPIDPLRNAFRVAFGPKGLSKSLQTLNKTQLELFYHHFATVQSAVSSFATARRKAHRGEKQPYETAICRYLKDLVGWASHAADEGGPAHPPKLQFDERFAFNPKEWFATSTPKQAVDVIHEARLLHLWKSARELLRPLHSEPDLPRPQHDDVRALQEHLGQFLARSSRFVENLAESSQKEWSLPSPMRRASAALKQVSPLYDELGYVQSRLDELVSQFVSTGVLVGWLIERIERRMAKCGPVVQALCAGTSREQLDVAARGAVDDVRIQNAKGTDVRLLGYCAYRIVNAAPVESLTIPGYGKFAAIRQADAVFSKIEPLVFGREQEFISEKQEGSECRIGLAFCREEQDKWDPLVRLSLSDRELRVLVMNFQLRQFEREVGAVSPKGVEHIAVVAARRVIAELSQKYLDPRNNCKAEEGLSLDDKQTANSLAELAVQLWYLRLDHGQLYGASESLLDALEVAFSVRPFMPNVTNGVEAAWKHLFSTQDDGGPMGEFSVDISGPCSTDVTVKITLLPPIHNELTKILLSSASFHSAYASLNDQQARGVRDFLQDLEAARDADGTQRTFNFLVQSLSMPEAGSEIYAAVVESLSDLGFFPRRSDHSHLLNTLGGRDDFVLELRPVDDAVPRLALAVPGQHGIAPARIVFQCPTAVYENNRHLVDYLIGLPGNADPELLTLRRFVVVKVLNAPQDLKTSIQNCVRTWVEDHGGADYVSHKIREGRPAEADEVLQILASTGAAPPAETSAQRLASVAGLRSAGIELSDEQTRQYLFGELVDELVIDIVQAVQTLAGGEATNTNVIQSLVKFLEWTRHHIIPEDFDPATRRTSNWTGDVAATEFSQEIPAGDCVVRRIGLQAESRELLPCEVVRSAGPAPGAYHELMRFAYDVLGKDFSLRDAVLAVANQWPASSLESDSRHQHWFSYNLLKTLGEIVLTCENATENRDKLEEFHNVYYDLMDDLSGYVSARWGLRLDVVKSKHDLGTGWQRYVDFTDGRDEWPESPGVFCVRPCLLKADGNSVVHKGIVKRLD